MPVGYSNDALELGLAAIVNRTIQVRLHFDDPGNDGTANPISPHGGYAHVHVAKNGFTRESAARFSNAADISFTAATGTWGEDSSTPQDVSWLSLWYDADDADNTNAGDFDTHLGNFQFRTAQTVQNGDPFVIRQRTLDIVSTSVSS